MAAVYFLLLLLRPRCYYLLATEGYVASFDDIMRERPASMAFCVCSGWREADKAR